MSDKTSINSSAAPCAVLKGRAKNDGGGGISAQGTQIAPNSALARLARSSKSR